jgi:hypothetical protein
VVTGKAICKEKASAFHLIDVVDRPTDGNELKGYIRIKKGCQVRDWSFLERRIPRISDHWTQSQHSECICPGAKNRVSPIVAMFGSRVLWRLPVVFGSDGPATKVDYAKGAAGCNRLKSPALSKFRASCGAADMAGFALIA